MPQALTHKQRKTFSLAPEAVKTIKGYQREMRAESLTAALERILDEWRADRELHALSASVDHYYSTLSPREVEEEREWAALAEAQFVEE